MNPENGQNTLGGAKRLKYFERRKSETQWCMLPGGVSSRHQ